MLRGKFWLIKAPRIGVPYFIVSVILAGIFYAVPPYRITNNFLSQLGQVYVFGELNLVSCLLFNIGMVIVGIIIALFYFNINLIFSEKLYKKTLVTFLRFSGILSGLFFSMVGVFTTDINFPYHLFFANNAFYLLLITSILHTYLILVSNRLSNHYAMGYIFFCIFLAMYVNLLLSGEDPSVGMPEKMYQAKHVVSQKLIALSIMIATLHQTIGIEKYLK